MGASNIIRLLEAGDFSVEAHTSDKTLALSDLNKIQTTRGAAGAVTFTLPSAAGCTGKFVIFWNVADQNMIVAGQDEELVVLNDLAANSIAFQTGGELTGGVFLAFCDGTSWLVAPLATETQTIAIVSG